MFAAIWSIDASSGCGGDARAAKSVLVGAEQRRHGHLRGRDRRMQRRVEREPLHRVVLRADLVEEAPEPAGAQVRVGLADLVVVARREVRLVGVVVADRLQHGHLALGVQRREPAGRRMPAQPVVLEERRALGLRDRDASAAASSSRGSPAGKSTSSASMPPLRKIETSTFWFAGVGGRGRAMPSSSAAALESALPP